MHLDEWEIGAAGPLRHGPRSANQVRLKRDGNRLLFLFLVLCRVDTLAKTARMFAVESLFERFRQ